MSKNKIAISWSGGKDAMMALHLLKQSGKYEIDHLHTVIGEETQRVGMHGIHRELMEAQAESLEIPIVFSVLPVDQSHSSYEDLMRKYCESCILKGIKAIAFGDIFLEDLKEYRENQLADTGLAAIFPLWKNNTRQQIENFIQLGYKTKICAGDAQYFIKDQVGKTLNQELLDNLPPEVDPCGENGEFHTFVYDGPLFQKPVNVVLHEVASHFYEFKVEVEDKLEERKKEFYFADFYL
ncbi:diphthine--ammonia ligase [Marivirga sp. S37H4]|uniref:Diphthine--ammonia ligase n=1 Tax=Marivirga aurantiaca TaxID=2802615 RepID=A0A934WV47_9BACT|nr:diphthine--ammonia ligase [Marivirga aurantiaca]MBK6263598.1 diphthine--ammonia ligase [Marivirga aurantiaca]